MQQNISNVQELAPQIGAVDKGGCGGVQEGQDNPKSGVSGGDSVEHLTAKRSRVSR